MGVVTAIVIILIGMATVNLFFDDIDTARDSSHLDCTNSSISAGTKLNCLVTDASIPFMIILIFSLAGVAVTSSLK